MRVFFVTFLVFLMTSILQAQAKSNPNPKWFACKRFSNCIKVTGNVCNRAVAVHRKYQSDYLDYVEELQSHNDCTPVSDAQIMEDLKKRPTCRDGKCILIIPKD